MKHAYVFPGQGAQAVGMGKDLYDNVPEAKALFEQANEILGFRITDIMFAGTDEELKQTKVTQPAVFLHSVIMAKALGVKPDAVAGHSLLCNICYLCGDNLRLYEINYSGKWNITGYSRDCL